MATDRRQGQPLAPKVHRVDWESRSEIQQPGIATKKGESADVTLQSLALPFHNSAEILESMLLRMRSPRRPGGVSNLGLLQDMG